MSINLGSILGFFICGYLGENIGWHYGFGAAGIGMLFGVIQYKLNIQSLGKTGISPSNSINLEIKKKYERIVLVISLFLSLFIISCQYYNYCNCIHQSGIFFIYLFSW